MEIAKGFKIAVASSYPEYWRYNVALMCGCFDGEDRRTGFASAESTVAPVGANLPAPPEGYASPRTTVLETPPCDHIVLCLYIIPHTLPAGRDISETKPFPLQLRIELPDGSETRTRYAINQWSGTSIELRIPNIK